MVSPDSAHSFRVFFRSVSRRLSGIVLMAMKLLPFHDQRFYPEGAGLPRYAAASLNYRLPGFTTNPLRGDTDVTHCFPDVHRAEPDLRHGPCGFGEPVSARPARRTLRAHGPTTVQTHAAVFVGCRTHA